MSRYKISEQFRDILRVNFEVTEKISDTYRVQTDQYELVELTLAVEETFSLTIPNEDVTKLRSRTVREWVDYIVSNLPIEIEEVYR